MNLLHLSRWMGGLLVAGIAGGFLVATFPQGDETAKEAKVSPEQAAVYKALEAFVTAFNANDPKGVAGHVTPDAEYIDEGSNHLIGAKQIEEVLGVYFKENKGAQLAVTPSGVRVVAPGIALEDAEAVITVPEKNTQTARRVSLVYAKVEGAWKVASYREYPETNEEPVNTEPLKDLAFLLGDWVDEGADSKVSTSFTLAKDGSHILREFVVSANGQEAMRGSQRIAVDPLTGSIKGWTFDSANGHGESIWTPNGDSWLIRGTAVTQDGEVAAATYIIKPLGNDRIEIKTMHKVIGNQVEPDATAVLVRKLKKDAPSSEKPTEKPAGN